MFRRIRAATGFLTRRGQPFRFIHGHSGASEGKDPNRFKLRRGTVVIFLERQNGTVLECLVSRKDFARVRRHHWHANKNGKGAFYAAAWIDGAHVQMHKHLCPGWPQANHRTATAWTIGARIFVELEEPTPTEPWAESKKSHQARQKENPCTTKIEPSEEFVVANVRKIVEQLSIRT